MPKNPQRHILFVNRKLSKMGWKASMVKSDGRISFSLPIAPIPRDQGIFLNVITRALDHNARLQSILVSEDDLRCHDFSPLLTCARQLDGLVLFAPAISGPLH